MARVLALVGTRVATGQLAEIVCEFAPHKRGVSREGAESTQQTIGSLFEQAAFVLLESLVLRRFEQQGADLRAPLERHANLEALPTRRSGRTWHVSCGVTAVSIPIAVCSQRLCRNI